MSGISLAAGQRADPSNLAAGAAQKPGPGSLTGNISFLQVQLLAYITVFTASGLVPLEEIATAIFISIYSVILSIWVFPSPTKGKHPPGLFAFHRYFPAYVAAGSVIGLFLPLAYVLGGFTRNDTVAVRAATPPLFLLSCQLLTENVVVEVAWISLPVRSIIPLLYSARRLVVILGWVKYVFAAQDKVPAQLLDAWGLFGRSLAIANMLFWSFNLFCFIIPAFLARSFRVHYELVAQNKDAAGEGKGATPEGMTPASQPGGGSSAPPKKSILGSLLGKPKNEAKEVESKTISDVKDTDTGTKSKVI